MHTSSLDNAYYYITGADKYRIQKCSFNSKLNGFSFSTDINKTKQNENKNKTRTNKKGKQTVACKF